VMEWTSTPEGKPDQLKGEKDFTSGYVLTSQGDYADDLVLYESLVGTGPGFRNDNRSFRVLWSLALGE